MSQQQTPQLPLATSLTKTVEIVKNEKSFRARCSVATNENGQMSVMFSGNTGELALTDKEDLLNSIVTTIKGHLA